MSSERERTGGRVEGPLARASPGATPPLGEVKSKVSLIRLADLEPLSFTNTQTQQTALSWSMESFYYPGYRHP